MRDSRIENCNFSVNEETIQLFESSNNVIANNTFTNNREGVLAYSDSINNVVKFNTFSGNLWYGVEMSGGNEIYLNNFINNTKHVLNYGSNRFISPTPITYTYNGKTFTNYLGNYYDDYTGEDADGDGIGDTPYVIDSNNRDQYPLVEPFENYFGSEEENKVTISFVCRYTEKPVNLMKVQLVKDGQVIDEKFTNENGEVEFNIIGDPTDYKVKYIMWGREVTTPVTNSVEIPCFTISFKGDHYTTQDVIVKVEDKSLRLRASEIHLTIDKSNYQVKVIRDGKILLEFGIIPYVLGWESGITSVLVYIPDVVPEENAVLTEFRPFMDTYSFKNFGSEISSGGMCFGMVATASHFYGWNVRYSYSSDQYAKLPLPYEYLSELPKPELDDMEITQLTDYLLGIVLYQSCRSAFQLWGWDTLEKELYLEDVLNRLSRNEVVSIILKRHIILAFGYITAGDDIYFTVYDPNYPSEIRWARYNRLNNVLEYEDYEFKYFSVIKPLNYEWVKKCWSWWIFPRYDEFGNYAENTTALKNFNIVISNRNISISVNNEIGVFNKEGIFISQIQNVAGFMDYSTDGDEVIDTFYAIGYPKGENVRITSENPQPASLKKDPITIASFGENITGITVETESPVTIEDQEGTYIIDSDVDINLTLFSSNGELTRNLTVSLPGGIIIVEENRIYYDENRDGVIDANLCPPIGILSHTTSDLTVTFDASSSYDPDGQIISYQWNFGDGTTASGQTVQHTYSQPGNYTVTLTVTDNDGLTSTVSREIVVSQGESIPDGINDTLEQIVSKYNPSFDWTTDAPTQQDVVQAVTNAVSQYFSTSDPTVRQEIVDDVTQLVALYFQL